MSRLNNKPPTSTTPFSFVVVQAGRLFQFAWASLEALFTPTSRSVSYA